MTGLTADGQLERWSVGSHTDPLVGKVTADGFHIKGETADGKYILERYVGFHLEQKSVPKTSIDPGTTTFSVEDPHTNKIRQAKIAALENAIKQHNGQILNGTDEAARVVGNRFVLDLRGASKWAAVDEGKAQAIRAQLSALAARLDPTKVVIITGGNRAGHDGAVENMVHDIFAGPEASKHFDIIGFMKHDTPADEVDKAVKYVVMVGNGDNWDGPVQAAQQFVNERRGATIMYGGGGVLERAAQTPVATAMKDRLLMAQGFGGASENQAHLGTPVSSAEDIMGKLTQLDPQAFGGSPAHPLKVGVYTGSFDPPHLGHKNIVDEMKRKFGLDIVYVVPTKRPPINRGCNLTRTGKKWSRCCSKAILPYECWLRKWKRP